MIASTPTTPNIDTWAQTFKVGQNPYQLLVDVVTKVILECSGSLSDKGPIKRNDKSSLSGISVGWLLLRCRVVKMRCNVTSLSGTKL